MSFRTSLFRTSVLTAGVLAGLTSSLLAAPSPRTVIHGNVPALTTISNSLGAINPSQKISLTFALPLRNQPQLKQMVSDLYNPNSPRYGQYLSLQQFTAAYGPTQDDYNAVIAYAKAQGLTITGMHPERTLLDVSGSAAVVEQAFGIQINNYQSPYGIIYHAPTSEPSLPTAIAGKLIGLVGLDNSVQRISNLEQQKTDAILTGNTPVAAGSGLFGGLIPSDIRTAYNLDGTGLDGTGQTLAVFELDNYTPKDILRYEQAFKLPVVPLENVLVDFSDPKFPKKPGPGTDEVVLDIDMQIALAPKASKLLVYVSPNTNQGVVDTYQQIATDDRAQSVSTSWGLWEDLYFYIDPKTGFPTYSNQAGIENQSFLQMAMQGQTIYAASGDNGGLDPYDNSPTAFFTQDPASQPFVCGVGGTTLTVAKPGTDEAYVSETTWNELPARGVAGGGGVSLYWPIPSYQTNAAAFAPASTSVSQFDRNVPDVSLNADTRTGYLLYISGQGFTIVGGTSAAAPLWAGFNALVNQGRAQAGKGPIGFINPALYSFGPGGVNRFTQAGGAVTDHYALDFHDIADGSNNIPYPAIPGYDLATGLGTFNGQNLISDLVALP